MPDWIGDQMAGVGPEAMRVFGRNAQTAAIPRRPRGQWLHAVRHERFRPLFFSVRSCSKGLTDPILVQLAEVGSRDVDLDLGQRPGKLERRRVLITDW